jgi:tetratricopeptide (TPR) repeat protein
MDGREQAAAVFVGRRRELGTLLGGLDSAVAGRGRLILIGGEPGIGKSRLADELARIARERGLIGLWGRGWEDAGAPAYWPWVQALRTLLRTVTPEAIRGYLGSGAADVAQMLPELRAIVPGLPSRLPDSDAARFKLFDSSTDFLRAAGRERAILIVLDDLQAADTPSILLLQFIASQLGDMRLLIVGTYRDVELTPAHPLTAAIAELAREPSVRVIRLRGLETDAVAEVIGAAAGTAPTGRIAAVVWRATNGNPLFVGEAVRLLSSEGRLDDIGGADELRVAIPAGVHAVIARRIGHLGGSTIDALRLGSALGPEFSLDALARIGDIGGDRALDVIDDAIEAGLLLPVAGVRGRYRFSHDLVRETLYDELPPGRRVRLHRRIAGELEDLYGPTVGEHLAELAFHFVQAAVGPDGGAADDAPIARKATEYARRAGDQATAALAYEEAARLYRMALAVMTLGGIADDHAQTETLLALGDALTTAGDLDSARTTFHEAADIARRTGNGRQLARAALGSGGRHQWARPGNDTRLIPLLRDALVMLGGDDETLRACLLSRLACAWRSSPDRRNDSETLSREAIDIARGLNDPATLVYTLTARFWATWWPENPEERLAIAEELLAIAKPLGDGERIADAHLLSFLHLSELGRIREARGALLTLARVIEEHRQPAEVWLAPVNRATLALLEGDYEAAEASVASEARSTYWITPGRDEVSATRMHRFLLRREQGRVSEEEAAIRESVVDFPWYPMYRPVLVCLLLDLGELAESRTEFEQLAAGDFAALYRDNAWLFGMSFAAEACARLGDASVARVLMEQLRPFAGRHAIAHAEGSVGAVDRYLGLLAATLDRLDEAEGHLTAAIAFNEQMGARPWAAHCQHDLAGVLRRRGRVRDAAAADTLDRRALATARALGMALAQEIEVPDAAPAASPETPPTWTAIFHHEGEYWTIQFERDEFRVRDSRGVRHLARLLQAPGTEVHALELAAPPAAVVDRRSVVEADAAMSGSEGAGPTLDAEAKAAYRVRLLELREELAEAESWHDPERVARLEAEQEALAHELGAALGIGGRDRPSGSPSERARISVTRAIRAAMVRIAEQSPALGSHLEATIRTGTYCAYLPDPRAPIAWRL